MRTKEEVIAEVEHLTQIHSTIKEVDSKYFKQLTKEAKNYELWSELIHIYCNLANIYFNYKSDYENSGKILKLGSKLLVKCINEETKARFLCVSANYYKLQHNYPVAIKFLNSSIAILSNIKPNQVTKNYLRLEFHNYFILSIIFNQINELPKFKYYILKAEKVAHKLGDVKLIINCYVKKADYYIKLKKFELAKELLQEVSFIAKENKENYVLGKSLKSLGDIFFEQESYHEALDAYLQSFDILKSTFPNTNYCGELCRIGEVYMKLNNLENATKYLELSYQESQHVLNKDTKIGILYSYTNFHKFLGNYKKVNEIRDEIDNIKYEIHESNRIKVLMEIEEKFQLTLKQKEINFRKKKQQDTNRYLKLMKQKNEDLQQFSYALAHDLREPIRSTKNFINVVAKKVNNPELDIYMNVVNGNLDRMYQLVDDILSLTKLDFDEVHIDEVDMNEIMEEIKDHLAMQIEERSANIVYGDLPKVMGNKNHLLQLFQNLISNGMKYNRNQPMIEIRYDATIRGKGAFMVKDNGIGIPADKQSQVFGLFKRAHGKEFQGTGVGLAICKKIVEKMKGEIWLESAEGKGSTFFMRLET